MLSIRPRCTCGSVNEYHQLGCDLMHAPNSVPQKKKRFFFFYPMKEIR